MSKHRMVDGRLLQMNKRYGQLKQKQKQKMEAYYTSRQWKDDLAMDEAGKFPEKLKRGVLSEDGIWNMLERNKELLERIGIQHRL